MFGTLSRIRPDFAPMMPRALMLTIAALLAPLPTGSAWAGPTGCPPGLVKKAVPCVPPGHARKWHVGEALPANVAWYRIDDWDRYGLPEPRDGTRYIMVDNEVLLIAIATGIVLDDLGVF